MIRFHAANIKPFPPIFQTFPGGWQLMTPEGGICPVHTFPAWLSGTNKTLFPYT